MISKILQKIIFRGFLVFLFLSQQNFFSLTQNNLIAQTWGEKLGFPKEKKVLILHADDMGMCPEANEAGSRQLESDEIQSSAVMIPCPSSPAFAQWYKAHPEEDIGIHLTLTSEWKTHRWGPVSAPAEVPGLIDPEGFLWHSVPQVVIHAKPKEIDKEIRSQIEKAISLGIQPSHIDTHMGTVYGSPEYAKIYMNIAMEYDIPAMVIEFTDSTVARFRKQGYPINEKMIQFVSEYSLPKLDNFESVQSGDTYEEKINKFFQLVQSLEPGITEIIFHPSVESDSLKKITNSWQQRVWEGKMFADPQVKKFFIEEQILFTSWKDMKKRFKERFN
jgi:predicted glycoside hydrolase/deacetylase ChbG (UPF0249 family)